MRKFVRSKLKGIEISYKISEEYQSQFRVPPNISGVEITIDPQDLTGNLLRDVLSIQTDKTILYRLSEELSSDKRAVDRSIEIIGKAQINLIMPIAEWGRKTEGQVKAILEATNLNLTLEDVSVPKNLSEIRSNSLYKDKLFLLQKRNPRLSFAFNTSREIIKRRVMNVLRETKDVEKITDYLRENKDRYTIVRLGNLDKLWFIPGATGVSFTDSPKDLRLLSGILKELQGQDTGIVIDVCEDDEFSVTHTEQTLEAIVKVEVNLDKFIEKRASERIKVRYQGEMQDSSGETIEVLDISKRGISFKGTEKRNKGDVLKLQVLGENLEVQVVRHISDGVYGGKILGVEGKNLVFNLLEEVLQGID